MVYRDWPGLRPVFLSKQSTYYNMSHFLLITAPLIISCIALFISLIALIMAYKGFSDSLPKFGKQKRAN